MEEPQKGSKAYPASSLIQLDPVAVQLGPGKVPDLKSRHKYFDISYAVTIQFEWSVFPVDNRILEKLITTGIHLGRRLRS